MSKGRRRHMSQFKQREQIHLSSGFMFFWLYVLVKPIKEWMMASNTGEDDLLYPVY